MGSIYTTRRKQVSGTSSVRRIPQGVPHPKTTLDIFLTSRRFREESASQRGDTPEEIPRLVGGGTSRYVVIVDTQTDVARVTPKVIPDRHLRSKCR